MPKETAGREQCKRTDFELFDCKLKCCKTCHFCPRAFAKERSKSRGNRLSLCKARIKICEQCFLCHSIVLCPTCNKCQKCCLKYACRGQTSKLLENLAGSGCQSQSNSDPKTGLHPSLPDPASSQQISHSSKLLCQSSQEQLPVRGITSAYGQKRGRGSAQSEFSRVFQPTVFGSQTQQPMEANTGPEQVKPFSQSGEIQNGNTGNHQNIPPARGVGHLRGLQGCLLPYSDTEPVQEISQIPCPRSDLPIQSVAFRTVHSTHGIHYFSQGGETDGHAQGYKDTPVPR